MNYNGPGADLGGAVAFPLRDSTPSDPKGPPFGTYEEIHFGPTDPKIFLKAPLAPIYSNFEGRAGAEKNAIFWSKFSKMSLKFCFWTVFSKIFLRRRKFGP